MYKTSVKTKRLPNVSGSGLTDNKSFRVGGLNNGHRDDVVGVSTTKTSSTSTALVDQTSFLSSVFSVAQNAALSFTSSITTGNFGMREYQHQILSPLTKKARSDRDLERDRLAEESDASSPAYMSDSEARPASTSELNKEILAIDTLGTGNLSLRNFGISDNEDDSISHFHGEKCCRDASERKRLISPPVCADESTVSVTGHRETSNVAQRAVSGLYGDRRTMDKAIMQAGDDAVAVTTSMTGQRSATLGEDNGILNRANSVRSRISVGRRRNREGNSNHSATFSTSTTSGSLLGVPGVTAIPSKPVAIAPVASVPTENTGSVGGGSNSILGSSGMGISLSGNSLSQEIKSKFSYLISAVSVKRNRDFHQLFRSVPEDDRLIDDYSAALQREILLQGRLYVSENHVCFSSNILGWVTNLVISYDEMISVEKKSTVMIFPNAIMIQTLHGRNVFASLVSRDSTYDLIIKIWRCSHPCVMSSINGVVLPRGDTGTGDRTERTTGMLEEDKIIENSCDDVGLDAESCSDDSSSFETDRSSRIMGIDRDGERDFSGWSGGGSEVSSRGGIVSRSFSTPDVHSEFMKGGNGDGKSFKSEKMGGENEAMAMEYRDEGVEMEDEGKGIRGREGFVQEETYRFPGPRFHDPTECGDELQHYDKGLIDTTLPAPLGEVYTILFGGESLDFMRKFLENDSRISDIQLRGEGSMLSNENRSFAYVFVRQLGASIGPRQTKCVINLSLERFDLNEAVTVLSTTQNPDVPSGSVFSVKTRYCLTWAKNNHTRFNVNYSVEWTGKSWIKGAIEKNVFEGQKQFIHELVAAINARITAGKAGNTGGNNCDGGAVQRHRRKSTGTGEAKEKSKTRRRRKKNCVVNFVDGETNGNSVGICHGEGNAGETGSTELKGLNEEGKREIKTRVNLSEIFGFGNVGVWKVVSQMSPWVLFGCIGILLSVGGLLAQIGTFNGGLWSSNNEGIAWGTEMKGNGRAFGKFGGINAEDFAKSSGLKSKTREELENTIALYHTLWNEEEREFWKWLERRIAVYDKAKFAPRSETANKMIKARLDELQQKNGEIKNSKTVGNWKSDMQDNLEEEVEGKKQVGNIEDLQMQIKRAQEHLVDLQVQLDRLRSEANTGAEASRECELPD